MNGWAALSDERSGPQVATTVDRAGALLQLLAAHPEGLSITVLTRHLNTQRAPLYRVLEALIKHRLVWRDEQKRYLLGVGTLHLARAYSAQLPAGLEPVLQDLADEVRMSASVNAVDGDAVTVVAAATPSRGGEYVFTPTGFVHPIVPTSMRAAIDALAPPAEDDGPRVVEARQLGFAVGRAETIASRYGVTAVVPGTAPSGTLLLLNLASLHPVDLDVVGEPLLRTAEAIALRAR